MTKQITKKTQKTALPQRPAATTTTTITTPQPVCLFPPSALAGMWDLEGTIPGRAGFRGGERWERLKHCKTT